MHMVVIPNSLIEILYITSNPGQDSKTALLLNIFFNLSLHIFKTKLNFSENYRPKSMTIIQYWYISKILVASFLEVLSKYINYFLEFKCVYGRLS